MTAERNYCQQGKGEKERKKSTLMKKNRAEREKNLTRGKIQHVENTGKEEKAADWKDGGGEECCKRENKEKRKIQHKRKIHR